MNGVPRGNTFAAAIHVKIKNIFCFANTRRVQKRKHGSGWSEINAIRRTRCQSVGGWSTLQPRNLIPPQ